jgi:branched-chain amino acid transport system permease protein
MKGLSLFLIVLALAPLFLDAYWLRVISSALFLSLLAYAFNLVFHYTNYAPFGGVAFFGLGAYTFALSVEKGLGYVPAFSSSILIPLIFALFVSPVLMRLKGHYFAIGTLALQVMLMELTESLEFTGGTKGIVLPLGIPSLLSYYLFFSLLVLCVLCVFSVERSRLRLIYYMLRSDELGARSVGVNVVLYRVLSLVVSSVFLGLTGSAFALWQGYIDAHTVYSPLLSVKAFLVLVLSSHFPLSGPLFTSFLLELIFEALWSKSPELHGLFMGLALVLLILVFPRGLRWKS